MSPPTVTEQQVCVFRSEIWAREASKRGFKNWQVPPNLLKDITARAGLNFMDAEDAEELEFLLN